MNHAPGMRANFASILKRWRLQHHIPLKQMAADLGFHISTVSAWEMGTRSPNGYALVAIVKYTRITPCRLFCDRTDRCQPDQCALIRALA